MKKTKNIKKLISTIIFLTFTSLSSANQFKEAPMLKRLVKAGKLPSVDERLPLEPYIVEGEKLVVGLDEKIGKYGGTFRMHMEGPGGDPHLYVGIIEPLLWAPGGFHFDKGIHGNIVRDWEVNDDYTEFTFYMRQGLKWSDGIPVTMNDVRFAIDDVLFNKELTPAFPQWLKTANAPEGKPFKIEYINEYTFKIIFDGPYGLFPVQLSIAGWRSYIPFIKPKHYLEKFHIKYNTLEKIKIMLREESIPEDKWYNLFNAKTGMNLWHMTNESGLGHPSLSQWVMKKAEGGIFKYERNPFYFKVDGAGNQLPYIDYVQMQIVEDRDTQFAKTVMGDFDYLGERSSLKNLPMLAAAQKKGLVKLYMPIMVYLPVDFKLNLNFPDPVWQEVTSDVRFRRALNFAINRPEIKKVFYLNQFAKMGGDVSIGEFSIEKANSLLDEMGMTLRDEKGYRMSPSGKPFKIVFELAEMMQDTIPMGEMISEHWKKVGINTIIKVYDWNQISIRLNNNEIHATSLWTHTNIWTGGWNDYLPKNNFGVQWHKWKTSNGKLGIEPPNEIKHLYDLDKKFHSLLVGSPESNKIIKEIQKLHRDNVWIFFPVEDTRYVTMITSKFKNVPKGMFNDSYGIPIMYSMEQWYIDEE